MIFRGNLLFERKCYVGSVMEAVNLIIIIVY